MICDLWNCIVILLTISLFSIGKLQKRDFIVKNEEYSTNKKGKREYLNDSLTSDLVKSLNEYFESKVEIPRIRLGE